MKSFVFAMMLLLLALPARAQREIWDFPSLRAAAVVGYGGGGPAGVLVRGAQIDIVLTPLIAVSLEGSSWDFGNGACPDGMPSRCDGSATAGLLGLSAGVFGGRFEPYARMLGGFHDFSGISEAGDILVDDGWRAAVGAEVGVRVGIFGRLGLLFGARHLRVPDDADYEAAVHEGLQYTILFAGLDLRIR